LRDGKDPLCGILKVRREKLTFPFLRTFYESSSALIEAGVRELVIDLADVQYIDSASLGCLMDVCRAISDVNGEVKLVGLREPVRTVVTMVGMKRHIEVKDQGAQLTRRRSILSQLHPYSVRR
jgi:anti-anti-sigma factor